MKKLGYTEKIKTLIGNSVNEDELARVIVEHKERYIVQSAEETYQAEITGNIRFSAQSRADFPAVGDWVKIARMDEESAIILEIFPRYSTLERQEVGKKGESQIIGTNIDFAFITQAVGHDFNLNRIERYLTICYSAGIEPIILLTKTDLIETEEKDELISQIESRVKNTKIIALSSENLNGFNELEKVFEPFKTYCFIGSSGVGKSTIINRLNNEEVLKTQEISSSTDKGRHTTSVRQLFVLQNGSLVIDTPGMRELGLTEQSEGIEMTYDDISELATQCRFSDCTHTSETGCAVLEALENGELSEEVYENYQKLKREQEHFSSAVHEKRKKEKDFGKMVKEYQSKKKRLKL